jgi:hypothetical protein
MAPIRNHIFLCGFIASCVAVILFFIGTLTSESPDSIALCLWHDSCEGTDVSATYKVGTISFSVLNIAPAILIAIAGSSLPKQAAIFAGVTSGIMIASSAAWWWLIATLCEKAGLIATKRRAVIAFLAAILVLAAVNVGIIYYMPIYGGAG